MNFWALLNIKNCKINVESLNRKNLKNHIKNKKAIHKSGKLFIGLTTKPEAFASKQHNYFECFSLEKRTASEDTFIGQKRFPSLKTFSQFSGLDGTRTRDPMRDRHVF